MTKENTMKENTMNQEETAQEIGRLADAWASAELGGDVAFLEKRLTDDFIGIGPLGFMLTKAEWLDRHRSGDLKYSALTLDEARIRVYDGAGLMTCRQTQQTTYRGTNVPGQFRMTLAFVRQEGRWQLAGLQLSAIGQPFSPPAQA
jgi:Domain of unknown function (DUF4440)